MDRIESGTQIGRYVVDQQIEVGRLTTRYLGRDPVLQRPVHIQQVHLTGSPEDENIRQRVTERFNLTRPLLTVHPQWWIQPIEIIEAENRLFIIEETHEAQTLEHRLETNPSAFTVRETLGFLAGSALALKPLHEKQIAHLDLEPANIFLFSDNSIKLTNPGLAPAIDWQYALRPGTVIYMAPEVLQGVDADVRCDIYAMGMLAYRMLAGEDAFQQAFKVVVRDQHNQPMRWMKWHTNPRTQAPPLSEIAPNVPADISDLVARMMQKSAGARFANADEVLTIIQHAAQALFAQNASTPDTSNDIAPHTQGGSVASGGYSADAKTFTSSPDAGLQTAALPARSKLPLVLVTLCGIWVLLGIVIGGNMLNSYLAEQRSIRQAAQTQLEKARVAFDDGRYEQAMEYYAALETDHSHIPNMLRTGRTGRIWAEALKLLEQGDYDQARENLLYLVRENLVVRSQVAGSLMEVERHAAFERGMRDLNRLIDRNQFVQAMQNIQAWQDIVFTNDERDRLHTIREHFETQRATSNEDQVIAQADDLWERRQYIEALRLIEQALVRFPQSASLSARRLQYQAQIRYDRLIHEARAAEQANDLEVAIDRFTRARQLEQDTDQDIQRFADLNQTLTRIRVIHLMEQAQAALENRQLAEAERLLRQVLTLQADHPEASHLLDNLASSSQRITLIRQGDRAFEQGEFEQATQRYEQAMAIEADASLVQKLADARYQAILNRGIAAKQEGELDIAMRYLQEAAEIRDDDPRLQQLLTRVQMRNQYQTHISIGQAALEENDFRAARIAFTRARDLAHESNGLINPEQTENLLDEVEYAHLFNLAQQAYQRQDYRLALANLQGAIQKKRTPEADTLLSELLPRVEGMIERMGPDELEPRNDSETDN